MPKNKDLTKTIDQHAGKDVYLLGRDRNGIKYWLEAPSFDCGWYWGAGYVETYRQNWQPSKARDIQSHEHANNEFKLFNSSGSQYNSNDTDIFTGDFLLVKTFTEKEGWQLRELFAIFYHLKANAAFFGRGGMHITSTDIGKSFTDREMAYHINRAMIPQVLKGIYTILAPENDTSHLTVIDEQKKLVIAP